jgi:SAM-dependent methyltransferase
MIGNRYEYDAMAKCEQQMWWYRCLHDLTLRKIKKNSGVVNPRILDAGCGTGGLLLQLKEKGYPDVTGFDLSPDAVTYARESSGVDVQLIDINKLDSAYAKNSFDIITSHDIVCLLQEGQDKTALAQLLSVLKPGGLLLMNFPALKAFNGTHDIAVGIQRRYSAKAVEKLVGEMAEIREMTYWPFLLSPAIFFARTIQKVKFIFIKKEKMVSDVKMPPALLNHIFYKLTSLENKNIRMKPWGSSLFLVLQKPI